MDGNEYDNEYATCARTHASLRAICKNGRTASVTERLAIAPHAAHDLDEEGLTRRRASVWRISTDKLVSSRDARRHVDHLLQLLEGKDDALAMLKDAGWKFDIFVFWESKSGHGGPMLGPAMMRRLAELELEIGFDCYYLDRESEPPEVEGHPGWRPLKL